LDQLPASRDFQEPDSQFDLGLLIVVTQKSLAWILVILILALGAAYTLLFYTQPVYESKSIIQIINENQANRILNVGDIYEDADISKDIELLRSPEFFKRVVLSLPLEVSYFAEGEVLVHERYLTSDYEVYYNSIDPILYDRPIYIQFNDLNHGTIDYSIGLTPYSYSFVSGDTLRTEHAALVIRNISNKSASDYSEGLTGDRNFFTLNSTKYTVNKLLRSYRVTLQNAAAKTVLITVNDNNALKAADICSQIADSYLTFDQERKSESANQVLEFINQQIEEVYSKLKISEDLITDFRQQTRLTQKKEIAATYIDRVNILERERTELDVQISLLNELKRNIDAEKTGVDIYSLLPLLAGSDFEQNIQLQIKELQTLVTSRNQRLSSATIDNPNVLIYDQQIEIQKNLILSSLDIMRARFINLKTSTESKILEIEQNFMDLPSKEIEFARLERIFNSHEKYYTMLLEKKTEFSISKAGLVPENTILQKATMVRQPVSPNRGAVYAICFSIALMIVIALITIRYLLNNDIDAGDLGALLHPEISVLGIVPKYSRNIPESQMIVDKRPKSIMAEAFRTIRTNLEFFESKNEKKVIAITSTISGEGKTFVAINLGGILAYSGKKVIILDLDMRRPRIHKGFNSENDFGMSTFLSDRDVMKNVIRKSELKDLDFITAGPVPPNPSELIINGKLSIAIEELKESYDIIIIDNPPVGLVTDGITCLRMADYPIYIFRSEYSKKSFAANVNRIYKENKIKNLAVILNSVDIEGTKYRRYGSGYGSKYGYGYGYGYGYTSKSGYYDEEESKTDIKKSFLRGLKSESKSEGKNNKD
jgi:tyrosine-protein kinase Etk/Wzc